MKKQGIQTSVNSDFDLSRKCLNLKGISKGLNLASPDLETRYYYGFLFKRHKAKMEYLQKRWCFLISSRPLSDVGYENDDMLLEEKRLPSWMRFDILYYYKVENENDTSEFAGKVMMR